MGLHSLEYRLVGITHSDLNLLTPPPANTTSTQPSPPPPPPTPGTATASPAPAPAPASTTATATTTTTITSKASTPTDAYRFALALYHYTPPVVTYDQRADQKSQASVDGIPISQFGDRYILRIAVTASPNNAEQTAADMKELEKRLLALTSEPVLAQSYLVRFRFCS